MLSALPHLLHLLHILIHLLQFLSDPPSNLARESAALMSSPTIAGSPDQSHDFDILLHNIDGGTVLHKHKHAAHALDDIDPAFDVAFLWEYTLDS
jgi:hypothetical protein